MGSRTELRPLADMSQVYVPPNDEYKIRVGPQKFNGALQPERYMVALGLSENLVRVVSCIPRIEQSSDKMGQGIFVSFYASSYCSKQSTLVIKIEAPIGQTYQHQ